MPDQQPPDDKKPQFLDEIVWGVNRSRLLFSYWTMPLLAETKEPKAEDVVSARAFALLVIVALTFAVRGDPLGGKISYTVLAAAVAATLSFGLSLLSRAARINVREPALVSAYASTILVMLGFLLVRALFDDAGWYHELLVDFVGQTLAAVVLSVTLIYVLLVLKAAFLDMNKLSLSAASTGLGITIGSGAIVAIIYYISKDGFDRAINVMCKIGACQS